MHWKTKQNKTLSPPLNLHGTETTDIFILRIINIFNVWHPFSIILNIITWIFRFSAGTDRHNFYNYHLNDFSLHQLKTWALFPGVDSWKVSTCVILFVSLLSIFPSAILTGDFCREYCSLFLLFGLLCDDTSMFLYLQLLPNTIWASISRGMFPFKSWYIQIPLNFLTLVLQPSVMLLRASPCSPDSLIVCLNPQYFKNNFTKSWRVSFKKKHSRDYQLDVFRNARRFWEDARHA